MTIGSLVRIHGHDQHDRDLSGMTGRIRALGAIYADVELTSWRGVAARVLLGDLMPVDPTPQSVRAWRNEHLTWQRRNARVIARMMARREERVA